MVSSIPISLSGLKANQNRLLASASNIANLQTDEYAPVKTEARTKLTGTKAVGVETSFVTVPELSLEEDIVNLIKAKTAYKANAFALKVGEDVEKSLIDELA